jgi:hypothetical protein
MLTETVQDIYPGQSANEEDFLYRKVILRTVSHRRRLNGHRFKS